MGSKGVAFRTAQSEVRWGVQKPTFQECLLLARSGRWWLRSLILDDDAGNSGRILISVRRPLGAVRLDVVLTTICIRNLQKKPSTPPKENRLRGGWQSRNVVHFVVC
jgi:hypothetical protein